MEHTRCTDKRKTKTPNIRGSPHIGLRPPKFVNLFKLFLINKESYNCAIQPMLNFHQEDK